MHIYIIYKYKGVKAKKEVAKVIMVTPVVHISLNVCNPKKR